MHRCNLFGVEAYGRRLAVTTEPCSGGKGVAGPSTIGVLIRNRYRALFGERPVMGGRNLVDSPQLHRGCFGNLLISLSETLEPMGSHDRFHAMPPANAAR